MVLHGTWADVERGACREREADVRPCRQRIPAPLEDLTEKVRAAHVLKHSPSRNLVTLLTRFTKVSENVIRMIIDGESHNKEQNTENEPGVREPGLFVRPERGQITTLCVTVDGTKCKCKKHGQYGRWFRSSDEERIDQRSIHVMKHEEAEKNTIGEICLDRFVPVFIESVSAYQCWALLDDPR